MFKESVMMWGDDWILDTRIPHKVAENIGSSAEKDIETMEVCVKASNFFQRELVCDIRQA